MILNPHEIAELERALKVHQALFEGYLNRDDINESLHYLPIAGQLRVLLCDADTPILLSYAKTKGVHLKVWAPIPLPDSLRDRLVLGLNFNVAGWTPFFQSCPMSIEKFLDSEIGFALALNNQNARPYTPRQVIKWVANKEGIAHLDFKKPQTLLGLKAWKWNSKGKTFDDGLIRIIILRIAAWAYSAIHEVLDPSTDTSIILRLRLKSLPKTKTPLFRFRDDHNAVEIHCSALVDGIEFAMNINGQPVDQIPVEYPKGWMVNADAVFCFSYSPSEKRVAISLNGEIKRSDSYDLGIIRANELVGQSNRGFEDNFDGKVTLYSRTLSAHEIHEILSLPFDRGRFTEE